MPRHTHSTNRPRRLAPRREPAAQPSPGSFRRGKRILLVDDDPAVRGSLHEVLAGEGYFVIPAEDGQQALNIAANAKVDLVLLDLNLPVKNGWDTFEQLTTENRWCLSLSSLRAQTNCLLRSERASVPCWKSHWTSQSSSRLWPPVLEESAELRLARMTGRHTDFHYLAQGGKEIRR